MGWIDTLYQQIDHQKGELKQYEVIKQEMEKLVCMTEQVEKETNEQVLVLEEKVSKLTEILKIHGISTAETKSS